MSSTIMRKPRGFFDLPLELRQIIYDEIHSIQGRPYFLGVAANCDLGGSTIAEARASDPRVDVELNAWMLKNTQSLIVTITNEPLRFPPNLNLDSLKDVHITIGHYKSSKSKFVWHKKRETWRLAYEMDLDPLCENLIQLSEYLRRRAPNPLRDITVDFEDDSDNDRRGIDTCWYKSHCSHPEPDCPDSEDEFEEVRIRGALWRTFLLPSNRRMPIVQYLLEPLWSFPKFQTADIKLPTLSHGTEVLLEWDSFSNNYMEGYRNEVQRRLQGKKNRNMRKFMERWRCIIDRSYVRGRVRQWCRIDEDL